MDEFEGVFEVLFVGQGKYIEVTILGAIRDAYAHILYLRGLNGTIYNWSCVVIMKKVEGK